KAAQAERATRVVRQDLGRIAFEVGLAPGNIPWDQQLNKAKEIRPSEANLVRTQLIAGHAIPKAARTLAALPYAVASEATHSTPIWYYRLHTQPSLPLPRPAARPTATPLQRPMLRDPLAFSFLAFSAAVILLGGVRAWLQARR